MCSPIFINGFLPTKYFVILFKFFILIISLDNVKDAVSSKYHKIQTFQKTAP